MQKEDITCLGVLYVIFIIFIILTLPNTLKTDKLPRSVDESYTSASSVEDDNLMLLGQFNISARCICDKCNDGSLPVENHIVLADPDIIPYDSIIEINGVMYVVKSSGTESRDLEICIRSHEEAQMWSSKSVDVYLVKSLGGRK